MRYFHIYHGLRGSYMPDDDGYVISCATLANLRGDLTRGAGLMRESYRYGGAKAVVRFIAAEIWARPREWREFVIPFGDEKEKRPYGLFVRNATRGDYLAQCGEHDDDDAYEGVADADEGVIQDEA